MNFKNLFKALFALVFGILVFVSCEPQTDPNGGGGEGDPSDSTLVLDKPDYVPSDEVYLFGNCKDSGMEGAAIFGFGDGKKHTFGGATLLSAEDMIEAGYYIVGIRVYIGNEVESGKVFVGEDYLKPEVEKEFTYQKGGWQYILFDQPYDYKKDIYIGFEATGSTDFLALESSKKTVKTEMMNVEGKWDLVSNQIGKYIWAIQAIMVGGDYSEKTQQDVVLERASVSKHVKIGEPVVVSCELRNAGVIPAENVVAKCTLGGETKTVNVSQKLLNGQSSLVNFEGFLAPSVDGAFGEVKVELSSEYAGDKVSSNNKSSAKLSVYSQNAVERNSILVEQFTGQGCGYCPGGAESLKAAISGMKNPEKVIWIAHHWGYTPDDFTINESETIGVNLGVQGAPSCAVDRMVVEFAPGQSDLCWHPGYSTTRLLEELIKTPGLATIELTRTFNAEDSTLVINVKGNSIAEVANITVLVKQSGIKARQASASADYSHNNAPRAFMTDAKGDALTLNAGNYEVSYTYKVPAKVGKFDCVLEDMEIVAFVHGDLKDSDSRLVYNAVQIPLLENQAQEVMRAMSLYRNFSNVELRSLSEQICQ